MERTILVPTDLHVGSLSTLKACLAENVNGKVRVILMHAMHAPEGISDLLFYSPRKVMNMRMGPAFKEAVAVLKNRFEQSLSRLEILPFHGITQTAFDEFVKGHGVQEIHVTPAYEMRLTDRAMDPLPFVHKASVNVVEHGGAMVRISDMQPSMDHLQLLFER